MSKREILTQKKWKTLEAPWQYFIKDFPHSTVDFFYRIKGLFTWARQNGLHGPVHAGTIFALGSYKKFQPGVSEMNLKRPKILGTSYGANFEKQRKHRETQKFSRIRVFLSYGNSYSCITAVKWDAYCVENTACNGKMPSRPAEFIRVTGLKCSYGQKILEHLPTREPGWKNGDLGNRASPPSHMITSKIL